MNLQQVYAEPCPNCGTTTEPADIARVDDGYNCIYFCYACDPQGKCWEAAYWAPPG